MKKFLIPLMLISSPAWSEPYTYDPEPCEFSITFPEKPFIETKCSNEGKDCIEVVNYTKAIGATSSTNFRVTCNSLSEPDVQKYTVDIIAETLDRLVKSNNLVSYDTKSGDENGYRSASTISLSEKDGKPLIYSAQIWVGKKSMFTIEAEMLGEQNNDIEKIFATIMSNTYPKDRPPSQQKNTEKKGK